MDNLLNWDKLLNINNDLIETTNKYDEVNILLSEEKIKYYDVIEIKRNLLLLFSKFRSIKYLNNYSVADNIRTTPLYDIAEVNAQRSTVSQVDRAVTNYVDKHLWISDFYRSIMIVASKLTKSESIYLINTFLSSRTEEDIAEKIGICKTSLQKIKKSCLVKMWIELKTYCEENDY